LSLSSSPHPNLHSFPTRRSSDLNPFFVEELVQALIDFNCLSVHDGRAVLDSTEVDIPESVQGTILARVDRLQPAERGLLQRAAVDRKSTRLNSSHLVISYAVFCL